MNNSPSPNRKPLDSQRGFTLIEIIITLVVFGILATMVVTVMGTSMNSSSQPIFRLQQTITLQKTMENIRGSFSANQDIALLKTTIGTGSQNNSYGVYDVIDNKFITFTGYTETEGVSSDAILKVSIKDQGTGLVLTELFAE